MAGRARLLQSAATGGPAVIVILAAVLSTEALRDTVRSRAAVERTYRVLSATDAMLSRLVEAETGTRAYLVTGESSYLEPMDNAAEDLDARVQELRRLITNRPQRARLEALHPVMKTRLESLDESIELRRGGPLSLPQLERRLARGKSLTDAVRWRVNEMQRAERALLRARSTTEARRTRVAFLVLVVGAAFSAIAAVLANALFARHAMERSRAAAELETKNQQLQDQAMELEETDAALVDSEQRFRSLVENSTDIVTVIGRDGIVEYQSRNVERVLGYAPNELEGRSALLLVHPEDRARVQVLLLNELLANPTATPSLEYRVRHLDGSWRTVESTASNLLDDVSVGGLVLNSRDLTERRAAELALRRSEGLLRQASKMEAVGRLAGGIAHDFNNLLTVIGGNARLLEDEVQTADGRDELTQIRHATDRATSLTRQLLVFSRRDALEPRAVRPNGVVRDVVAMLRRLVSEEIAIHVSLGQDVGAVRIDSGQLEQVIINLAVNASDAMPDGGQLTIETQKVEVDADGATGLSSRQAVLLAVSDTGHGMDEETQAHVFEPFFTTKAPGKGTGLGLSTVYGIVHQNGGNLWVRSEPGRGTRFEIYLPQLEIAGEGSGGASVVPAEAQRGSESILLVEDEPGVRALASRVLRQSGYTVLEADSPDAAIGRVQDHSGPIHLLLTDVVMPGGSGTTLAERMQTMNPGLKILFMSGHTEEKITRHGMLQPGVAFLQKPFALPELCRMVRQLLDAKPNHSG